MKDDQEPRYAQGSTAVELRCMRCLKVTTTFSLIAKGAWQGQLLCLDCAQELIAGSSAVTSAVGPSETKAGSPAKG